jgi:hypothetical protein
VADDEEAQLGYLGFNLLHDSDHAGIVQRFAIPIGHQVVDANVERGSTSAIEIEQGTSEGGRITKPNCVPECGIVDDEGTPGFACSGQGPAGIVAFVRTVTIPDDEMKDVAEYFGREVVDAKGTGVPNAVLIAGVSQPLVEMDITLVEVKATLELADDGQADPGM